MAAKKQETTEATDQTAATDQSEATEQVEASAESGAPAETAVQAVTSAPAQPDDHGLTEYKMGRATVKAALVDREMVARLAEQNGQVVRFDPHRGRYVEIDEVRVYVGDWYVEHPTRGIMSLSDEDFQDQTAG